VTEDGKDPFDYECSSLVSKPGSAVKPVHDFAIANAIAHRRSVLRMQESNWESRGEVVATTERGLKARVVSKHDANLAHPGHSVRKAILAGLKRDRRVNNVLRGDHRKAVESAVQGWSEPSDVLLSSDLTAASDLLPLDLI